MTALEVIDTWESIEEARKQGFSMSEIWTKLGIHEKNDEVFFDEFREDIASMTEEEKKMELEFRKEFGIVNDKLDLEKAKQMAISELPDMRQCLSNILQLIKPFVFKSGFER